MVEIPEIHPLIEKLIATGETTNLVALVGYQGPASREKHVRIYHRLDLTLHSEVPADAVELCESLDPNNPHSPYVFVVQADARVHTQSTRRQESEAGFLRGSIADGHLRGASSATQGAILTSICTSPLCCCTVTTL